jgi:hypothetical protein
MGAEGFFAIEAFGTRRAGGLPGGGLPLLLAEHPQGGGAGGPCAAFRALGG